MTALKIQHNPFAKAFLDRQNILGCSSGSPLQNQVEDQEFQLVYPEANSNAAQQEVGQFSTNVQLKKPQLQQHRFHQRYMPYNSQQRIHNKNVQMSGQNDSLILKEEPGLNYWRQSTSSPGSSCLETSALTWNSGCSPKSGAYFCPPLTSTPLGKQIAIFFSFYDLLITIASSFTTEISYVFILVVI